MTGHMRDIDARRALRQEVKRRHQGETDTLVVEELGVCQGVARVDFAVINGSIHGYEIKSERDTLVRLPAQSDAYSRALEFVTIVAAQNHLHKVVEAIPDWWGIWTVIRGSDTFAIEAVRGAQPNPSLDSFALVQFLWREEALGILSQHGRSKGLLSKPRTELWRKLTQEFSTDELAEMVRQCLKRRGEVWRVDASQLLNDDSHQLFAKW